MAVKLWGNYFLVASGYLKSEPVAKTKNTPRYQALQKLTNRYNLHDLVAAAPDSVPEALTNNKSVKALIAGIEKTPDIVIISGIHTSNDPREHITIQRSEDSKECCHLYVKYGAEGYEIDWSPAPEFRPSPVSCKTSNFVSGDRSG